MRKTLYKVLVGMTVVGTMAFGGTALAQSGTSASTPAPQAPAVTQSALHAAQPAVSTAAPSAATAVVKPDTDNIQDQNGADDATEVQTPEQNENGTSAESESAEQPGNEQPGNDGPGGHADEPGNPNADHQFEGVE